MLPARIQLPSGRTIEPLRLRMVDIDLSDIAFGMGSSLVVNQAIRLDVSLAQLAISRRQLFVSMTQRRGLEPRIDAELFLMLKDAWQYLITEAQIELRTVYDPTVLRQISMLRHHVRLKLFQRFGIEERRFGKQQLFVDIADRLATEEVMVRRGGMSPDRIVDPDLLVYRDITGSMTIFDEVWMPAEGRHEFHKNLEELVARKNGQRAA